MQHRSFLQQKVSWILYGLSVTLETWNVSNSRLSAIDPVFAHSTERLCDKADRRPQELLERQPGKRCALNPISGAQIRVGAFSIGRSPSHFRTPSSQFNRGDVIEKAQISSFLLLYLGLRRQFVCKQH
jgi:hypothetical protein